MSDFLYYAFSGAAVIGILVGINLMSNVKTAVKGNLLGGICTAAAIIVTLVRYDIVSDILLWACMIVGLIVGFIWAYKVEMIQMPQLVALYNGFGGAASAIIALITLFSFYNLDIFTKATAGIALVIGIITFVGSLIAAGKLHKVISQHPLILKGHSAITTSMLILSIASIVVITATNFAYIPVLVFTIVISTLFSIAFTVRIGGADMPITISLLNSLSGVAGAIAGMAVNEPLLVAIGGIVGASGLLLTQVMCRSMNRSLMDILLGKTSVQKKGSKDPTKSTEPTRSTKSAESTVELLEDNIDTPEIAEETTENILEILKTAKNIIIVPGYGMALAQAQHLVKDLADKLDAGGAKVSFAIHPVAGRMPGHMNVLLSEADIPYERLYELDDINPEFDNCDVTIIIGANDVVNPAAQSQEGTPIYGMPILNAYRAKHIIICNYDLKPGYAGVDNPLYSKKSGVTLLLGDAKESLRQIIDSLNTKVI